MPESTEAQWLRRNWNREKLGNYDKSWIAVLGNEVIAYSFSLAQVVRSIQAAQGENAKPLYAFVVLGRLQ